jgi:cyclopropane fatty-acyl-phospholipid synthase-like methyltransferase
MAFHFRSKAARRTERLAWQHVGLVAGFLAGRHFVGLNDLHYGYWLDDVEPCIRNLAAAQNEYSKFLISHIPKDVRRILDVGCGAGGLASKLIAQGHEVDCISPSSFLNGQAKNLLGDRAHLYECRYEDFQTAEPYDAIVFCESFQYVDKKRVGDLVTSQLRRGGSLVICDFFCLPAEERSPIGGGHPLNEFRQIISRFPFRLIEDIDITSRTAPTYNVIDQAFNEVLRPIWDEVDSTFATTHRIWSKCVNLLFKKRITKVEQKYFGRKQSADSFQRFKSYRLMRFERE